MSSISQWILRLTIFLLTAILIVPISSRNIWCVQYCHCQAIRRSPRNASKTHVEATSLTELYNGVYNICCNGNCDLVNTTFKQLAGPKGPLWQKICVDCNEHITTKSFGLMPVTYCKNVRNDLDYETIDDDDVPMPRCENVICGKCLLEQSTNKRRRTQRKFDGFNGR